MILRTVRGLTPSVRIGMNMLVSQFSKDNKDNGFGRFKKVAPKRFLDKELQKNAKQEQKKDRKTDSEHKQHDQKKKAEQQQVKLDPKTAQQMKATGFSKFIKNKPVRQEQKEAKSSNKADSRTPQTEQSKKQAKQSQKTQPYGKFSKKNQNKVSSQGPKGVGFQKFKRKSPQKAEKTNFKKEVNKQKEGTDKKSELKQEKAQKQPKQERKGREQHILNQKQQQDRAKKEEDLEQGQKFFREELRKFKAFKESKQRQERRKEPESEFEKKMNEVMKNLGFQKQTKEQEKIPSWISENSTFLSVYMLLKLMKPFLLILFGSALVWVYVTMKNRHLSEQVDSDFLYKSLQEGTIRETWLQKINKTVGQEVDEKTILYVHVKLDDGSSYKCVSNEDFQNTWKNQISNYNTQVATLGFKPPVIIKPSIHNSPVNYMETARTLLSIFVMIMIFRSLFATGKKAGRGGMGSMDILDNNKSKRFRQTVNVKFSDVMGMQKSKEEIVEFIDFLMKPDKYNKLGARIPRGALLTGPPGTGKTMIAKACAGQSNVPFFTISGSQFMEMYVGVGAQRVRDIFKQAKQAAPSIIFIDEIDAVGKKRASGFGGGHDERDNTLNQLLVEMDGFDTSTNVIVFAATNQKEVLDPALTRPGRFDRLIEVDLPDLEGRKQIFMIHLKPIVLNDKYETQQYAKRMATLTPGFSGADIKNLCNQAAIIAARGQKSSVTLLDFELATERIIGGVEKKSSLITPETRKTVAYHECGHGVVSWFLEGANPLLKLTIIPRSKGALGFAQYLPNENQISSRQQLQDQICVILGGRICEQIFFSKASTGAYDDLQKAYHFAKEIVAKHGMGEKLGWLTYDETEYAKGYSQQTEQKIDEQIMKILKMCSVKTREVIIRQKDKIEKLAETLLEKQTIDQNIIESVLGERPFKMSKQYQEYLKQKRRVIDVQSS